jgi:hypothetical protein
MITPCRAPAAIRVNKVKQKGWTVEEDRWRRISAPPPSR